MNIKVKWSALLVFLLMLGSCSSHLKRSDNSGLLPIRMNTKFGYMDYTGMVIIEPQFDDAHRFAEGLAAVKVNREYGYIDTTGQMVIPPRFNYANEFAGGIALVFDGRKYGYIDSSGRTLIDSQFTLARSFSEGLAAVQVNDNYGYIDTNGRIVIEPQFHLARDFAEGLAAVQLGGVDGYIDKSGKMVLKANGHGAGPGTFSEGLAYTSAGYIDRAGRVMIPSEIGGIKYLFGNEFSEGLAVVQMVDPTLFKTLYCYLKRTGSFVFVTDPFMRDSGVLNVEEAKAFSSNRAAVKIAGHWRFIDQNGQIVIEQKYDKADSFDKDFAYVERAGRGLYINKQGLEFFPPQSSP